MRSKIYYYIFKKEKQYSWKMPYITYWGCDNYHWLRVHSVSWVSILGNRVNGNTLFTVLFDDGKITIDKD